MAICTFVDKIYYTDQGLPPPADYKEGDLMFDIPNQDVYVLQGGVWVQLDVPSPIEYYEVYNDVRAATPTAPMLLVGGRLTVGDGGGGFFARDNTNPSGDNDGTVLVDAAGDKWVRVFDGNPQYMWFWSKGTHTLDAARIAHINSVLDALELAHGKRDLEFLEIEFQTPNSGNLYWDPGPSGQRVRLYNLTVRSGGATLWIGGYGLLTIFDSIFYTSNSFYSYRFTDAGYLGGSTLLQGCIFMPNTGASGGFRLESRTRMQACTIEGRITPQLYGESIIASSSFNLNGANVYMQEQTMLTGNNMRLVNTQVSIGGSANLLNNQISADLNSIPTLINVAPGNNRIATVASNIINMNSVTRNDAQVIDIASGGGAMVIGNAIYGGYWSAANGKFIRVASGEPAGGRSLGRVIMGNTMSAYINRYLDYGIVVYGLTYQRTLGSIIIAQNAITNVQSITTTPVGIGITRYGCADNVRIVGNSIIGFDTAIAQTGTCTAGGITNVQGNSNAFSHVTNGITDPDYTNSVADYTL